jgi:hypothetical protein
MEDNGLNSRPSSEAIKRMIRYMAMTSLPRLLAEKEQKEELEGQKALENKKD